MASKSQRLRTAAARQRALNAAETKATEAATERDQAFLAAAEDGATYADLEQVTGLSNARVTQILRKARERAAAAATTI